MSAIAFVLAKTAADEGKDIILGMLVVGLIIVGVVVLGDLNDWRHRRHRNRL
jgi:hypothetical protein